MLEPGKGMDPELSFGVFPLFQCLLSTKSHLLRENIQTEWTLDSGSHTFKFQSYEYHFLRQVPGTSPMYACLPYCCVSLRTYELGQ